MDEQVLVVETIDSDKAQELDRKSSWLISLRWAGVGIALLLLILGELFPGIVFIKMHTIITLGILLGVPNAIFHAIQYYFRKISKEKDISKIERGYLNFFLAQVAFDYVAVTYLIMEFGFLNLNLAILYVPHLVLTSILFHNKRIQFLVLWSSIIIIYVLTYLNRDSFIANSPPGDLVPYVFNAPLTFALFVTGIFNMISYLVSLLAGELIRSREDLFQMNKKLIAIDQEKQSYTLRATHELKAPFAAVQGYIQVIQGGYLGEVSKEISDVMEKINTRCSSLSSMIKDIIQLSQLGTSRLDSYEFQKVEIVPFVEKISNSFKSQAGAKDIRVEFQTNLKPHKKMNIAPELIEVMLNNLISNAINYSDNMTVISVKAISLKANETVQFSVKDQGIGIPAENIEKIFNEHFRSNNAVAFNQDGNGMGLAIVKKIAMIHDGNVDVVSVMGEGSEFIVQLPEDFVPRV